MYHDMLNIVVVGDGTVGKTCLLHAYTDESFKDFYQPTIYDKASIDMTLDGHRHTIQLHDTAGQEDYDRIRKQFYKKADCFLLCYSIENPVSFSNITDKWISELTEERRIPIVLIATKLDLRMKARTAVSTEEVEELKRKINATSFVECSVEDNINVQLAFEEAVRACLRGVPEPEPEKGCCGICSIS
ncbi:ras-like GTP-binding protein RhoL isoform X2 [Aedes aegypti]|uniref:Uncharacterized protein n=1 Tax=Aedes aegypti TaxID=7159 RepID=A0A6I8TMM7_AEDAE|nr:ras-like GTP-binding protein RhoL isoform X2 [Aedes aegypti]